MTRRNVTFRTIVSTTILALVLLAPLGNKAAFAADEDESQEALIKMMDASKVSLQQGLAASEREGRPISAKFEVDDGKLQLSVYAAKQGKFSEVLVDYATGEIAKVEPIEGGEDLAAARAQDAAMAKAKMSLRVAVDKVIAESAKVRALRVVPSLVDGHPVASLDVLSYNEVRTIQQPLDE
jgi:hypothetical protein